MKEKNPKKELEYLDDPPEERIEIGPRIPTTEDWVKDWVEGVEATGDRWKRRVMRPKAFAPEAAVKAVAKYKAKLKKALEAGYWEKKLGKITIDELSEVLAATTADDFIRGATKRKFKMHRRIDEQRELRVYAATKMDAMPQETDAQRERKMLAARKTNIIIGEFLKGIIDATTARSRIDDATKPT